MLEIIGVVIFAASMAQLILERINVTI